jgi:type II restriction enzyme
MSKTLGLKTKDRKSIVLPKFIKSSEDLQTKHKAICDGFLHQAIQKTEVANKFVERAKQLQVALSKTNTLQDVLALEYFKEEIISACGFSEKSKSNLEDKELDDSVKKVLTKLIKDSRKDFREEILYRYLLTSGDALGGTMRNITGSFAGTKFAKKIVKKLKANGYKPKIKKNVEGKIQRIIWDGRLLMFDVKPELIGKNIDVILLYKRTKSDEKELLKDPSKYLVCGELKGGIDPAGADEHWKTANTSLGRIRIKLKKKCPPLFFVGAAIEASMAEEIFNQLKNGKLAYAANLNEESQLDKLVDWLIKL